MSILLDHLARWCFDRLFERIELNKIEIAVLDVQPGDVIVIKSQKALSDAAWHRITTDLKTVFPNNTVIALENTLDLAIQRTREKMDHARP